ncbi:MAG TPA: acyltransferase family protein [Pseudomonadales bacterium]|nr:acyltransferase family protein [Pseudomonadales bacterium]
MHAISYKNYRPDIDGLRAIAVSSVIGYHAFPAWVSGGFVGVDIFFVISGFLISTIILSAATTGNFSVLDFYARRIRRIFPALLVMLVACLFAGWLLLFPDELKQLGKHTLAATGFVANFVFWSEAGYFDTASELKPLLHLWSLSIEEQFYTVWPVTLLFFIRSRQALLLIVLLAALSFLLCVAGGFGKVANFYMPLTRMWELLAGGLLAAAQLRCGERFLVIAGRSRAGIVLRQLISASGFIGLLAAIFMLTSKTVFPGWAALLPVAGTVCLMAAGPDTAINRYVLGNPVFVAIGLISYPLYLWHWPLLSFPKIVQGLDIDSTTRISAVVLAVLCATLTYWLVEKPLRHQGKKVSLVLLLLAITAGAVGFGFAAGYIQPRQADALLHKISDAKHDDPFDPALARSYNVTINDMQYRAFGHGNKTTLFLGDSNMDQHWLGVEASLSAHQDVRRALLGGCGFPLPHVVRITDDIPQCKAMNERAFELATNDPDVDTLVLGAQWRGLDGYQFVDGNRVLLLRSAEGKQQAMEALSTSIRRLREQGKTVYLLLNIPGGKEFEPHNLVKRSLTGFHLAPHLEGGITLDAHKRMTQDISPELIEAVNRGGGVVLDPADLLCKNNWCSAVTPEGEPIYRDGDHLRGSYSYYHPEFIAQALGINMRNEK